MYTCIMEFLKNTILVEDICLVQIQSADAVISIPDLTTIYHTPSKITLTGSNRMTENGVLTDQRLSLVYPGLSDEDFTKFHDMVRGVYQVFIKTMNNDVYELSSTRFFMECENTFNIRTGQSLTFKNSTPIPAKYRGNYAGEGINVGGFDYDFDFYLE